MVWIRLQTALFEITLPLGFSPVNFGQLKLKTGANWGTDLSALKNLLYQN